MASVLDNSLVDSLLGTIDDLRGGLLPEFGTRQFTVKIVRRTWSGEERGDGDPVDEEETITPVPRVVIPERLDGLRYELRPEGRHEEGSITISEISLANYQEDDLTGGDLAPNVEIFWALEDAHGQGIRRREYVLTAPPFADREKSLGWVCNLRRAQGDC